MNKTIKQLHKHKKLVICGLLLVLIIVLATYKKRIKIIDKTNSLMRSSSKKYTTRSLSSITQIVVHHSASIGQRAEDYARYHVLSKGWAAIGYHFVIEANGDIIQTNPLYNVSYNVSGYNSRSIGICLSGDFSKQQPSPQQLESLKQLIKHLRQTLPQALTVAGHQDFNNTSCPGKHLAKHLYQFQTA